jgi:hypothetical protein
LQEYKQYGQLTKFIVTGFESNRAEETFVHGCVQTSQDFKRLLALITPTPAFPLRLLHQQKQYAYRRDQMKFHCVFFDYYRLSHDCNR